MTLPGCRRCRTASASMPRPMRSWERSRSRAWASVRFMMVGGSTPPSGKVNSLLREFQLLFGRDESRFARQLIEKLEAAAVLLVQSIVDVPGEVNLHRLGREPAFWGVLFDDFIHVREAKIA